jgi:pyruvyltransferase
MFTRTYPAYWWTEKPNFGDALAPHLLSQFSGLKVKHETISNATIVTIGSVLEHIPPFWRGYVLGAGMLYPDSRLHLYTGTMDVLALRGPLTAMNVKGDYALGDPGLLADELVEVETKKYDVGVVPHWQDDTLAMDPRWYGKWYTHVIDPAGDPLDVTREIGECKKVVTSSLHGMVVADAFGIPRRVEESPAQGDGGWFKFEDYSASVKAPFEPGKVIEASRHTVEERKHELYDAYQQLASVVRNG